jgi:hypothetical protein
LRITMNTKSPAHNIRFMLRRFVLRLEKPQSALTFAVATERYAGGSHKVAYQAGLPKDGEVETLPRLFLCPDACCPRTPRRQNIGAKPVCRVLSKNSDARLRCAIPHCRRARYTARHELVCDTGCGRRRAENRH